MALIRGNHTFDEQFTQIPNAYLRDPRLSLGAIGLLSQLMSHKPGWEITQENLARANNVGRDAIRSLINQLLEAGYLQRSESRQRNSAGQLAGYDYTTCDPMLGEPTLAEPTQAEPTLAEPLHKNTITQKTIEKKTIEIETAFEEFWAAYPKKTDKGLARRSFAAALKKVSAEELVRAAESYRDDPNRKLQFTKNPSTWLNAEAWENEALPSEATAGKPAARVPGKRDWVELEHNAGEHWACKGGEFGHPADWQYVAE